MVHIKASDHVLAAQSSILFNGEAVVVVLCVVGVEELLSLDCESEVWENVALLDIILAAANW